MKLKLKSKLNQNSQIYNQQNIKECERDYHRIAQAIEFITLNFKNQPSLNDIASEINLSPFHFQRLFTRWAGVSPKKFMQYLSVEYAKNLLKNNQASLMDAAYETRLSGSSRLHDLFIKIEAMNPGEFKNGGDFLTLNYSFAVSHFGDLMIASTHKGICHISFIEDKNQALNGLKKIFPNATYFQKTDSLQQPVLNIFENNRLDWFNLNQLKQIKLHLQGTAFQLKVWQSLLKIPMAGLVTYGDIAKNIFSAKSSRAVGSAVGSNPVAFLIPCHRVIQASGKIGGYRWGETRKKAIIGWEAGQNQISAD